MPVFQKLVDFDQLFHTLPEIPIILNDIIDDCEEDKEKIKNIITTYYSSDMVSLIPSCQCGAIKGEYSTAEDIRCDICNTHVLSTVEESISPTVWFRRPNGVNKLISPIIWIMLKRKFTKSGFNIIQWLCDTTYRPEVTQPRVISKLVEAGIQRGYNNFVDHFDMIIEFLYSLKDFKVKKGQTEHLQILIQLYRPQLFSDYIPMLNKSLLIIDKTNVGIYADKVVMKAINAIQMLVSIDRSFYDQTPSVKENRTIKALAELSSAYEEYIKLSLAPKPGQLRTHVYATRTNFSFRAVISSRTDKERYDEIDVPWGIGLTAFRPHLINKLMRRGYGHNAAMGLILGNVETYHPLLDELLQELITECPDKGPVCLLQRNPSLLSGSAQQVYLTKFKTDPRDNTIGVPILICRSFNADFDRRLLLILNVTIIITVASGRNASRTTSLIAGKSC